MKKVKAVARAQDPICGMIVNPKKATAAREHMGRKFYFCSLSCAQEFDANPHRYLEAAPRQAAG